MKRYRDTILVPKRIYNDVVEGIRGVGTILNENDETMLPIEFEIEADDIFELTELIREMGNNIDLYLERSYTPNESKVING